MGKRLLTITLLCLMMSAKLLSQSSLGGNKTVVISIAEMDSIAVKLIALGVLQQYVPLLELQVEDLKLVKHKQGLIIKSLEGQLLQKDSIIVNLEQAIMEYETILEAETATCKIEKKRIRKRLLILGGSGFGAGLLIGLVTGLIAN